MLSEREELRTHAVRLSNVAIKYQLFFGVINEERN